MSCFKEEKKISNEWHYENDCKDDSIRQKLDWMTNSKYTDLWFRTKMEKLKKQFSSEQSSQDCGYFSGHNISSPSLPSTPEGSEVACCDECCDHTITHEGSCRVNRFNSSISLLMKRSDHPTLTQMLKVN